MLGTQLGQGPNDTDATIFGQGTRNYLHGFSNRLKGRMVIVCQVVVPPDPTNSDDPTLPDRSWKVDDDELVQATAIQDEPDDDVPGQDENTLRRRRLTSMANFVRSMLARTAFLEYNGVFDPVAVFCVAL
jgi:hypothetical protein